MTGNLLAEALHLVQTRYHVHSDLVNHYRDTLKQLLDLSVHESGPMQPGAIAAGQPWDWVQFVESPQLGVGILTVYADQDIPLHDHPGSTGLLVILRGKVRIRSYNQVHNQESPSSPMVELQSTSDEILKPGQYWHFGTTENNVHTLQAIDGDCRIFDILFSPYQLQQRSFFMPIDPDHADAGNIMVRRLTRFRESIFHNSTKNNLEAN